MAPKNLITETQRESIKRHERNVTFSAWQRRRFGSATVAGAVAEADSAAGAGAAVAGAANCEP